MLTFLSYESLYKSVPGLLQGRGNINNGGSPGCVIPVQLLRNLSAVIGSKLVRIRLIQHWKSLSSPNLHRDKDDNECEHEGSKTHQPTYQDEGGYWNIIIVDQMMSGNSWICQKCVGTFLLIGSLNFSSWHKGCENVDISPYRPHRLTRANYISTSHILMMITEAG